MSSLRCCEYRELEGKTIRHVRALAAYKDFLTLWKDADPDILILKQARAEYAKLQWRLAQTWLLRLRSCTFHKVAWENFSHLDNLRFRSNNAVSALQ
jgi:hypothetical protein